MSTITDFYNKTFSSKRMVKNGSNRLDTESTIVSSASCYLKPVTDKSQLFNSQNFGKEFDLYFDSTLDVKTGDVIIIDTVRYGVQGVSTNTDMFESSDSHTKASIVLKGS